MFINLNIFSVYDLLCIFIEKLAEEPSEATKKAPIKTNVNKWDGEDEDEVKVSSFGPIV